MKFHHRIAGGIVALGLVLSACGAQAGGPPDQATAKQAILTYLSSDGSGLVFTSVQIGPGHTADAQEARQVEVDLDQMVYPVGATYTTTAGSGPSAYIRDYVAHYYVYQKADGHWEATTNSQPGDGNHLRGT